MYIYFYLYYVVVHRREQLSQMLVLFFRIALGWRKMQPY
jgi:hypothetical protein